MPSRRKQAGALGVLVQKSFWTEIGRSLKRIHKDRRARKQVFGLVLLLLIPLAAITWHFSSDPAHGLFCPSLSR